jgi:chemotaxis protein CheY-P-specific phosphatase CheC
VDIQEPTDKQLERLELVLNCPLVESTQALATLLKEPASSEIVSLTATGIREVEEMLLSHRAPVFGVFVMDRGETRLGFFMYLSQKSAKSLSSAILDSAGLAADGLLEKSCLAETCSIFAVSFLNLLHKDTGLQTFPSIAYVSSDAPAIMLGEIFAELLEDDRLVLADVKTEIGDRIAMRTLIMTTPSSGARILDKSEFVRA